MGDLFADLPGVVIPDGQLDAVVGGQKRSDSDDSGRKRGGKKKTRKQGPRAVGKRRT